MYAILSEGKIIALCDKPRYVRMKKETNTYIEAKKEEAEALAVNGTLYNLPGGAAIPDAPEAIVTRCDGGGKMFEQQGDIAKNAAATVKVENALCDLDAAAEARAAAFEDALCDMDSVLCGGGETV